MAAVVTELAAVELELAEEDTAKEEEDDDRFVALAVILSSRAAAAVRGGLGMCEAESW